MNPATIGPTPCSSSSDVPDAVTASAADGLGERAYYCARAAVEMATVGETDRSNELIQRATSLSTATGVSAIAAALAEDPKRVLALLPPEDALAEPYFVLLPVYGLRANWSVRRGDSIPDPECPQTMSPRISRCLDGFSAIPM